MSYIYIYQGAFKKIHVFLMSEQQAEPADAQGGGQLKPTCCEPTALKHPALPHINRNINNPPQALRRDKSDEKVNDEETAVANSLQL